jgi:heme exporter protein D
MPNFELGKYALYIWPPYLISVLVIGALVIDTLLRTRRWKREVERLEARKSAKKKP